jgi:hypothetical protein
MDTNTASNVAATHVLVWGIVGIWILTGIVALALGLRLVYILIWTSDVEADFSWQTSGGAFGSGGTRRRIGKGLVTFVAFLFSLTALGGMASMTGPTVMTVLQEPAPKDGSAPSVSVPGKTNDEKQPLPAPLTSNPKGK